MQSSSPINIINETEIQQFQRNLGLSLLLSLIHVSLVNRALLQHSSPQYSCYGTLWFLLLPSVLSPRY